MALEFQHKLSQDIRLTQELVMTPQLQQAIKLLQLTRLELVDRVQEEIEQNPLLEEAREEPSDVKAKEEEGEESEADRALSVADEREETPEVDWEQYAAYFDESRPQESYDRSSDEKPQIENYVAFENSLSDHLLWQLRMEPFSEEESTIGTVIIGNIDDDGYLRLTLDEVVELSGAPIDAVEDVLETVQEFDPSGVASRDLAECLTRQAKELGYPEYVVRMISGGLKLLETKNYKKLARELSITFDEVVEGARLISELEPRPGRAFSKERVTYVTPDVYVIKREGEYIVSLNEDGLPKLRVSPYYRSILSEKVGDDKEAKGYIQERMQAAVWLIKAIEQRQQTLLKVANSIVRFQRAFLDHGVKNLRPLILKDVADDIEMHESTVSRITTGKYMHTPHGTFELKYFFSSAIQRDGGEDLASRSVKERIKEIISREDAKKPYSDLKISKILEKEYSLKIARRTVSKYRESMGILPSSSRRSYL